MSAATQATTRPPSPGAAVTAIAASPARGRDSSGKATDAAPADAPYADSALFSYGRKRFSHPRSHTVRSTGSAARSVSERTSTRPGSGASACTSAR